jgi:CheY-like chemotaxis protein
MLSESEFRALVAQAYERLYDLVYLRCHPLADLLIGEPAPNRKERAWKLHHLLLAALADLDPGPGAPAASVEVRRHQLMVLRYADGLDPQTTADRIGISRRHFYREHEAALDAVAQVLWQRYADVAPRPVPDESPSGPADRAELLRQEAVRLAQADRFAHLHEVLPGVLSLLGARLCQRSLAVDVQIPPATPPAGLDRALLRQLLLAALSLLAERCAGATLTLAAEASETHIDLRLAVALPPPADHRGEPDASGAAWDAALAPVRELADLGQAQASLLGGPETPAGLVLRLPRALQHTVLVVDDNRDALDFFHRVLPYHGYRVVSAANGREALHHARTVLPDAIVLDVMMPEQDGWDVLQILRVQPETHAIPVVICSVLRASELALSMGANAFLAKPITEEALLDALRRSVAAT